MLVGVAILAATGGAVRASTERTALKVPVCQRTKSDARPYLRVVVQTRTQLRAHLAQHADIVPARGACPKVAVTPTQGGRALTTNLSGGDGKPPRDPHGRGIASARPLPS